MEQVEQVIEGMKNRVEIIDELNARMYLHRHDGVPISTIISISDIPKIAATNRKWCALWKRDIENYYVKSSYKSGDKEKAMYLHRVIMDAPEGVQVDHINRNTLNNTRQNLRLVTASENQWNKGPNKDSKSGIKNINWNEETKSWTVKFYRHKKHVWLGRYKELTDAISVLEKYEGANAGFEVEQTPGEKVRGYYKTLSDIEKRQANAEDEQFIRGEQSGVKMVLNLLNIKIDGVNT